MKQVCQKIETIGAKRRVQQVVGVILSRVWAEPGCAQVISSSGCQESAVDYCRIFYGHLHTVAELELWQ